MERGKKEAVKRIEAMLEGQETDGERSWWDGLDEETKDLLKLLLTERMSYFTRRRVKVKAEQMENERRQLKEWKNRLGSRCQGMEEEVEAFLDWLVSCQGNESDDAYLFGIQEGIRMMRMIYSF